jgi:hypothetical protein
VARKRHGYVLGAQLHLNAILPVLQRENDFDVTTEESGSGLRSDKRISDS